MQFLNNFTRTSLIFSLILTAKSLTAVITTGDIQQIVTPTGTIPQAVGLMYLFPETTGTLASDTDVDIFVAGLPAGDFTWTNINPGSDAGTLASGTVYNSYMLSHDQGDGPLDIATGTITFENEKIIGIIISGGNFFWGTGNNLLLPTDSTLGAPATDYNTPANSFTGYEPAGPASQDTFTLSADLKMLTLDSRITDSPDRMRIITMAVPEPETYLMVATFLGCAIFCGRKKMAAVSRKIK